MNHEDRRSNGTPQAKPVRFQRLAEQVADDLRNRILLGDLGEDTGLPVEEVLRAQYPVSKPTLREAMRVLEAEGLITVRRGSVGGAIVHPPTAANVAYTLGLVLASRRVDIADVGTALRAVEPSCAAACAERPDRAEAVVPELQRIHDQSMELVDDLVAVTSASRAFHEAIVDRCGNESLSILAGALEAVWSTHEADWAHRVHEVESIPRSERIAALEEHQVLIDLIAAGDADGSWRHAAAHLLTSQTYPGGGDANPVEPDSIRRSFVAATEASN